MVAEASKISKIVEDAKWYFTEGKTLDLNVRLDALTRLEKEIRLRERDIEEALYADLGKSAGEAFLTELYLVYNEISLFKRKIKRWSRKKRVIPSIANFPGIGEIHAQPYGTVLIISPWNYPFQLCMMPLIAAIGAGNNVILKPSSYSENTSRVIAEIIEKVFEPEYVSVILGGRNEISQLLKEKFDYIFFTGSMEVGKTVMKAAAEHLTPVSLELGGKSPVIVDETAEIPLAAKRIIWGKLLNAGQTCVAPDYILAHYSIFDELVEEMKKNIHLFFGDEPTKNAEYPKIINVKHFNRLKALMEEGKGDMDVVEGGYFDDDTLKVAPTIIEEPELDTDIMSNEIFGPLLPILSYDKLDTAINFITSWHSPLALYLFTSSSKAKKEVLKTVRFGGGCINDTVVHVSEDKLPFGGIGSSGMGRYHGKLGFDTFTHYKSVLKKATWMDVELRYPSYTKKTKLYKKILGK